MTLRRLPENSIAASKDETLADAITAYFTGAPWPVELANEAHISRFGHDVPPPTPYGAPWPLESGEQWLAHGLGTFFFGLEARGEFKRAGAAAILVTTRGVRLVLGSGGPEKPSGWLLASKGERNAPRGRLEPYTFRFIELTEIGAGDLMFLHFWRLEPLVLRVPWPRSMAALISGLRAIEKQPNALENSTVTVSNASKSQEIIVKNSREIMVEKKLKR